VRYAVPAGTDIDVYRKAIEDLPPQEGPEIFGLNPNADLTFRSLQARHLLSSTVACHSPLGDDLVNSASASRPMIPSTHAQSVANFRFE
jgi:hypothetical protein